MSSSLVVPAYNEEEVIDETLQELESLTDYFEDVYLIDDDSTDHTRDIIEDYLQENDSDLHVSYMLDNGEKIGAIKDVVDQVKTDTVILTDADTRLENPEKISDAEKYLEKNNYQGMAFRINPSSTEEELKESFSQFVENPSLKELRDAAYKTKDVMWERFQDFDYAIGRAMSDYTTGEKLRLDPKDKNLRCVAGAGGIFETETLQKALEMHSGRHAGDDMETTSIIQLKLDGDIDYFSDVEFETEVPKNYNELRRQRNRWQEGTVQSFSQNPKKHIKEMFSGSRYGQTIALETWVSGVVPLAVGTSAVAAANGDMDTAQNIAKVAYALDLGVSTGLGAYAAKKEELRDNKSLALTPLVPFYRASVFYPSKLNSEKEIVKDTVKEFKKGLETENNQQDELDYLIQERESEHSGNTITAD